MASSDVRDVLNLPDGFSGPRPAKKQKLSAVRSNLKGLAREVHNLGGDNPIAIVPAATQFKKRRLASRKPAARWELRPFHNSGRDDPSLILRHWRRKDVKDATAAAQQSELQQPPPQQQEGQEQQPQEPGIEANPEDTEDSLFAKFNVRVSVPQYSQDQYEVSLRSDDWTKAETDYLMEIAGDFDLRWPLIWDRYEWNPPAMNGEADVDGDESKAIVPTTRTRSMEDLKGRYYEVAAKMMAAQKPVQYMTQPEFTLHEIMAHFNPKQEKLRKEFAMNTMSRSREEAREEESLLLEIKRILSRSDRFNEERRELYTRLDYPRAETDINTFKSSAGLQTLLQNLMNVDKTKKRKSIMGPDGINPAGAAAAQASAAPESGKRDSAAASNAATRESTGAASTPTAAGKKGQPLQEKPEKQLAERRKLNSQEEAVYGVTHHDRLGSGPTFRTEKINKLFSHKSNQQQLRINNTLNELDVPSKLAMPTAATTLQYEQLLAAVNSLLDARKVSDKLDADIKVEQAKKAEREKALGIVAEPEKDKGQDGKTEEAAASSGEQGDAAEDAADETKDDAPNASKEDGAEDEENPEEIEDKEEEDNADDEGDETIIPEVVQDAAEKQAEAGRPQRDKSARPGSSSGPHKRSASVLSAVSDKSAKRQKK